MEIIGTVSGADPHAVQKAMTEASGAMTCLILIRSSLGNSELPSAKVPIRPLASRL